MTTQASTGTGTKLSAAVLFSPFSQTKTENDGRDSEGSMERSEWDRINFITTSPLAPAAVSERTKAEDFAPSATTLGGSDSLRPGNSSSDSDITKDKRRSTLPAGVEPLPNDMKTTRMAIQRQLRFMFIYPMVYIILWILPFVNHCMQYSDYLTMHPPFWAQLLATICLSSQAGVDAIVFSWRERPWRRRRGSLYKQSRLDKFMALVFGDRKKTARETEPAAERLQQIRSKRAPKHWWDLEARSDRRDSVMGDLGHATIKAPRRQGTGLSTTSK